MTCFQYVTLKCRIAGLLLRARLTCVSKVHIYRLQRMSPILIRVTFSDIGTLNAVMHLKYATAYSSIST